jgi:hypothetical protein
VFKEAGHLKKSSENTLSENLNTDTKHMNSFQVLSTVSSSTHKAVTCIKELSCKFQDKQAPYFTKTVFSIPASSDGKAGLKEL